MYTIRKAAPADAHTFLSLIDALADYEKLPRPDDAAKARLFDDAFVRTPARFDTYLLLSKETALGYAVVFETYSTFLAQPTLYLEDLFLLPEARGKGAGSVLFRFLATEALSRGCGRMEWACLNWNQLAIDFYAKRGAEHLSEWRAYRMTKEQLHDAAYGPG